MRPDPEIMLDEPCVTDRLILPSHCHAHRIVRGVLVRKLVVTECHQTMMTDIALIAITVIVSEEDVVVAADPDRDGDASRLRTTIPLMTAITVTGPVMAVHQNLTGWDRRQEAISSFESNRRSLTVRDLGSPSGLIFETAHPTIDGWNEISWPSLKVL